MYGQKEILQMSNNSILDIPIKYLQFKKWSGSPIKDDYNGKTVIDFDGEPLFAELAVLRMYQKDDWAGVWVDCYRKKYRVELPEKSKLGVTLPKRQENLINRIKELNGGLSGCWDLFLWKGNKVKFIELKRSKKDQIRPSQKKWFKASIKAGVPNSIFLLVEWGLS